MMVIYLILVSTARLRTVSPETTYNSHYETRIKINIDKESLNDERESPIERIFAIGFRIDWCC